MTSMLIVVAAMVLVKHVLWPTLKNKEINSWRDLLSAGTGIGKIALIIFSGILVAGVLDRFVTGLANGNPFKVVVMTALSIVCFYGVDHFMKGRGVAIGERIFIRGLYPLMIVFILKPSIMAYSSAVSETAFLVGAGGYIFFLSFLWLGSYWKDVQPALADLIGLIILAVLFSLKRYMDSGRIIDFSQPDWWIGVWPLVFHILPLFAFTLLFWKVSRNGDWRQRWTHRSVVAGHICWFIYALPYIYLMGVGEMSPAQLTAGVQHNQLMTTSVETKSLALDHIAETEKVATEIREYERRLKANDQVPADIMERINLSVEILQEIEKKRAEIYASRPPQANNAWKIIQKKIKGAYEEYAPQIKGVFNW